jgi:uncharacterized SAM-binding protein YcdF (DUF218 family)
LIKKNLPVDNTFWVISKVIWGIVAPETSLLILLILGTVLMWTRRNKAGSLIVTTSVVIIALISILPFSTWIFHPLENRFPVPTKLPEEVDGIIVLAGAENISVTAARGQPSLNGGGERLTTFVWLARLYPNAILLFSGGSGSLIDQKNKPGDTARKLFDQLGLKAERVQYESDSKNTAESALKSYQLVQPKPDQNWILVTSAFHMARSVGLFRKVGWQIIPYPVDFSTTNSSSMSFDLMEIGRFSQGLREWVGLVVYRMKGQITELFPRPHS